MAAKTSGTGPVLPNRREQVQPLRGRQSVSIPPYRPRRIPGRR